MDFRIFLLFFVDLHNINNDFSFLIKNLKEKKEIKLNEIKIGNGLYI